MEIVFLLTGQLLFAIFFTENIPAIINKLEQSKNADHKISEVVKYYKLQRIHFDNIIKNTFQYRASFSCIVILISQYQCYSYVMYSMHNLYAHAHDNNVRTGFS